MKRIRFLNTYIDNLSMSEALDEIDKLIKNGDPSFAVTPNVDHIVQIERGGRLAEVYDHADLVLTDGMPLVWISRLLGTPIKEKVSGSDLFPLLCEMAAEKGYRVFLLGAEEGVAEMAAKNLQKRMSKLNIVGTYSPKRGFEKRQEEIAGIIERIREVKPHILIVALGCPKQEEFIYKYKNELQVPFSVGLGASIDFEAGVVKRAPKWMRDIGLEWLHRIFQDPKRLAKRYLVDDRKIFGIVWKYRKQGRKKAGKR